MDYKKKYDEALERAKRKIDAGFLASADLSYIFPELAESEDERIRKGLIEVVSDIAGGWPFEEHRITKKEALAYLKKQKEQKHTDLPADQQLLQDIYYGLKKL